METSGSTKMGTAGGTLLVVLMNITAGELVKTSVLAAVGAIVSYGVSNVVKHVFKRVMKK